MSALWGVAHKAEHFEPGVIDEFRREILDFDLFEPRLYNRRAGLCPAAGPDQPRGGKQHTRIVNEVRVSAYRREEALRFLL